MDDYSDDVLNETPGRVTHFLFGLSHVPAIHALMLSDGKMKPEDLTRGGALLLAVLTAPHSAEPEKDTPGAKAQREAEAELDHWDEPTYGRAKAALHAHFREQEGYVFRELAASSGPEAVTGAATFLARLDALEHGTDPERAAQRVDDKKAVKLLAERGIDADERKRVGKLVKLALAPVAPPDASGGTPNEDARRTKLVALKRWYDEWAHTAHAVVRKRQHLLRLGLAERHAPTHKAAEPTAKAPEAK